MSRELKAGSGTTVLKTPDMLREEEYSFREVVNSNVRWEHWGQPNNPLKIIIFSNREGSIAINGFVTYQVASDILIASASDSDNQSEVHDEIQPEPESPRSGTV